MPLIPAFVRLWKKGSLSLKLARLNYMSLSEKSKSKAKKKIISKEKKKNNLDLK